jgi:SAM-dependent methyltransferase
MGSLFDPRKQGMTIHLGCIDNDMHTEALMKNNNNPWWNQFFDDHFADLLLEHDEPGKLANEVDFIINELQLKPGDIVFDQCCGTGRIACELAARGMYSVGVDQSKAYIERATQKAQKGNLNCEFYHADALQFICPKASDAGLNWYTSFGYSDNDAVNLQMLKSCYEGLKPNARFILDYFNPAYIFQNFAGHFTIKKLLAEGELVMNRHSSVDLARGMLISTWNYVLPDGRTLSKTGESRIYFARDLSSMLRLCGFKIVHLSGDISGSTLTKDSPRCIITVQK